MQRLNIAVAVQTEGAELEPDKHSDLKGIMNEITEKVHQEYPDCCRRIF